MKLFGEYTGCALISLLIFVTSVTANAQTGQGGKKISPDLFGLFFEDLNYSADGGLYAELVQNRSFEYNPAERREWSPFSYWEYITPGFSYGRISVETSAPVHPDNPYYIVLDVEHVGHNVKICPTPNYYIQEMFMTNQGDIYFDNVITWEAKDTTLASSCVQNGKTGDIILKLVNAGKEAKTMNIDLSGFKKIIPDAEQTMLAGDAEAENTFENPRNVVPVITTLRVRKTFDYAAPAMSLTIIRIKTNQ